MFTGPVPKWQKQVVGSAGCLLLLAGVLPTLSLCFVLALLTVTGELSAGDRDNHRLAIAVLTVILLTVVSGGLLFLQARRSIRGRASKPVTMPGVAALTGFLGLALAAGGVAYTIDVLGPLVFAPALILAAALPPVAVTAWFARETPVSITRRQTFFTFIGGATLGIGLAIGLSLLLPTLFFTLILELSATVMGELEELIAALSRGEVAEAVTGPGFLYALIQLALIAPVAEELAKSLVALPLVARVSRRDAFMVGALAGAGFAALENVLYASSGVRFWGGILLVRALGCAVHPLGAGLTGLGWRAVLRKEAGARRAWLVNFGTAAGIHALWNGGSLLVITLAGARFFGDLPPEIDVLGLSAGGTTLAFLVILGIAALWLGQHTMASTGNGELEQEPAPTVPVLGFGFSDRNAALWAIACLVTLVPAGIAGLKLILGGK